jgi:hypothetical protein
MGCGLMRGLGYCDRFRRIDLANLPEHEEWTEADGESVGAGLHGKNEQVSDVRSEQLRNELFAA